MARKTVSDEKRDKHNADMELLWHEAVAVFRGFSIRPLPTGNSELGELASAVSTEYRRLRLRVEWEAGEPSFSFEPLRPSLPVHNPVPEAAISPWPAPAEVKAFVRGYSRGKEKSSVAHSIDSLRKELESQRQRPTSPMMFRSPWGW